MKILTHFSQTLRALATRQLTIKSDAIPYHFKRLPLRKLANAILTEVSILFKPLHPWGWPTHLMVEPTNLCNLRCALCPVTEGFERPQGRMDFSLFKELLNEVGEYIFTLQLWDWGEPFVHPRAYDMIDYAKSKGIKVISSTNGHKFARKEHAERLVCSGLDTIIFAIDGMTQQTYEFYRQGGKLETALEGIRQVVAAKKTLRSNTPTVNFRFIPMAHNEHEIPLLRKLTAEMEVDVLSFKTLNNCQQDPYKDQTKDGSEFLPQQVHYQRFKTDANGERIRRRRNPCKQLWNNPSIHWNGKVSICSLDPQDRCIVGDLNRQSFQEIWRGQTYRQYRREFSDDWNKMIMCGECSYAYKGGSLSCETIAEAVFYPSFGNISQ